MLMSTKSNQWTVLVIDGFKVHIEGEGANIFTCPALTQCPNIVLIKEENTTRKKKHFPHLIDLLFYVVEFSEEFSNEKRVCCIDIIYSLCLINNQAGVSNKFYIFKYLIN